jgi:predicted RNA-binding Zn-ribbon protein involved in translation (DUF1610 family)
MKRRALKLFVFLLAGAIINVAVAWGLTLSRDPRLMDGSEEHARDRIDGQDYSDWNLSRRTMIGSEYICSQWDGPSGGSIFGDGAQRGDPEDFVPHWAPELIPTKVTSQPDCGGWAIARSDGWPFIALGGAIIRTSVRLPDEGDSGDVHFDEKTTVRNVFVRQTVDFESSVITGDVHLLPYGCLFPGFAINTIFYAAIAWGLFAVLGTIRKGVRHKRGQCASCGYSLRGASGMTCPECGATAIPSPSRERARVWVKRDELDQTQKDSLRSTHPPTPSLNGGGES